MKRYIILYTTNNKQYNNSHSSHIDSVVDHHELVE